MRCFILSLFLVNSTAVLYPNLGCLKCICGMHFSPAYKTMFTIAFILYFWKTIVAVGKSRRVGTFIPANLLNNPLNSSSLINFYFLLLHTAQFHININIPILVSTSFGILFSIFFYTSNNKNTLFCILFKLLFVIRIFSFFLHTKKFI